MKMGTGDDDSGMDDLYQGSMGDDASTSKDDSGDEETIDQEDQEEMAGSSVVPMDTLKGPDGKPVKRGDVIEVKVMDVYGGKDVKICRADKYKDDSEEPGEGTPEEEQSPDEELDTMSQRM